MGVAAMSEWIFTFGFGHEDAELGPLRSCFVRIRGTFNEAREQMVQRFGRNWSMQYKSEEAAGVQKYGLREIDPW